MASKSKNKGDVWARPGMIVTFRAEVMPGLAAEKRTFRVKEILPNGEVTLYDFAGEHAERAFVPVHFKGKQTPR